jgi:hypothetical protein
VSRSIFCTEGPKVRIHLPPAMSPRLVIAPKLGQHNAEIFGRKGLSEQDIAYPAERRRAVRRPVPRYLAMKISDAIDRQTAIDDQLGAGNVLGLVGGEEQRRVGDIPSIAHASHWTLGVTTPDHLFGAAAITSFAQPFFYVSGMISCPTASCQGDRCPSFSGLPALRGRSHRCGSWETARG